MENLHEWNCWGAVRRAFAMGVFLGMLLFLVPLLVIGIQEDEVPVLPPSPTPVTSAAPSDPGWDESESLRVMQEDGTVEELTFADYLWRVVAAEMPASFEEEALRAQAVCARTYSLWKIAAGSHREEGADLCTDSGCCQAYLEPEEAAENWGESARNYTEKIARAVADTDGQVLTYGGEPIQAVFFSSSTDVTEDAAQVWGGSLPYLVSVASPEGEEVPNYHSTVTMTGDELRDLVLEQYPQAELSGDPGGWISEVSYNASGRVSSLKVGGITLSGGAARALFGLRSACFQVEESGGEFTFSVTGYGHGVGMSQYGANAMAKQGDGWREIVSHYYTGVCVENWNER